MASPKIKFTPQDCKNIASRCGLEVYQTLVDKGMSAIDSADIVESLEEALREFLEEQLLDEEEV